jgi:hypothetical protein
VRGAAQSWAAQAEADPAKPWAACAAQTGRAGTVDVGHTLLLVDGRSVSGFMGDRAGQLGESGEYWMGRLRVV